MSIRLLCRARDHVLVLALGAVLTSVYPQVTRAVEVPLGGPATIERGAVPDLVVSDLNGDGALDLVAIVDNVLYWYQNSGTGAFTRRFIDEPSDENTTFRSVKTGHLNGDGDVDIFLAAVTLLCSPPLPCFPVPTTTGYENATGNGQSWTAVGIGAAVAGAVADMDSDGDDDLVINQLTSLKWRNPATGAENTIGEGDFASPIAAADTDGDCDLDVVAVCATDGLVWFENVNGLGTSWDKHIVADVFDADVLATTDLNKDDRMDVIVGDRVASQLHWYRNAGSAILWPEGDVDLTRGGFESLSPGDVNTDGSADLLAIAANGASAIWYDNEGFGTAWSPRVISEALVDASDAHIADLNGDHRGDIVYSSDSGGIKWWDNRLIFRSATFPEQLPITTAADDARSVAVVDLDADGDLDVVSASAGDDSIRWYENNGAASPALTIRTISSVATGAVDVTTGDIDGDGDEDVIAALETVDDIIWYENDGTPQFGLWASRTIAVGAAGVRSVAAGDVDCDGDLDVLSADYDAGRVRLWRNNGASPPGWSVMSISPAGSGPTAVAVVDWDGDGDADVISSWAGDNAVRWHRNDTGAGNVWTTADLATGIVNASDVFATDLNEDGAPDVVVASLGTCASTIPFACSGKVLWIENGTLTQRDVDSSSPRTTSVSASDLDLDGDIDVLATSASTSPFQAHAVKWYENSGEATPTFTEHTVISGLSISRPDDVAVGDIDRDGDPDVVSASRSDDTIAWYRNGGGQYRVSTVDVAPASLGAGAEAALLKIMIEHNGRVGDSDVELLTLDFLFEQSPGDPLDTIEGLTLLDTVLLYRDDGDGTFEIDQDILVRSFADPLLSGGVLRIGLNPLDGQPVVAIQQTEPATYFLSVLLASDASSILVDQFLATHLATRARLQDRSFDIPVLREETFDVASSIVAIARGGDCSRDGRLTIDDWSPFIDCFHGPTVQVDSRCTCADMNGDQAIDLADVAGFQVFVGRSE